MSNQKRKSDSLRILCILSILFFIRCGSSTTPPLTESRSPNPNSASVAIVNVVMHIENTQVPNVDNLISAIDALGAAGIPLSLGADMEWIQSEARASEVFTHVLTFAGALDVHYHQSAFYNRADLANEILSLGFSPTNIASGYTPDEESSLRSVITPQLGGSTWQADYLWGLATPGHADDDTSWGITQDANGGPPMIGNGEHTIASTEEMIALVTNNTYPGYLLTSAIMLDPVTLTVVNEDENATAEIVAFKNTTAGQSAQWLTLEDTGTLADTNYTNENSRVESGSE